MFEKSIHVIDNSIYYQFHLFVLISIFSINWNFELHWLRSNTTIWIVCRRMEKKEIRTVAAVDGMKERDKHVNEWKLLLEHIVDWMTKLQTMSKFPFQTVC